MKILWNIPLAIALTLIIANAHAQTSNLATITSPVISGGGGTSSGGGYILDHTVGEAIIGTSGGANFSFGAGFWEIDSETTSNVDLHITANVIGQFVTTENIARSLTLNVSNRAGLTATSVQLLIQSPPGLRIIEAINNAGTTAFEGSSNVTCQTPTLPSNGSFTVQLTLRPIFLSPTQQVVTPIGDLSAVASSSEPDANFSDNYVLLAATVVAQTDWGDARGGFPVTAAENGAFHRYSPAGPWLGTRWDNDGQGNHSPLADFDDTHGATADEDGVQFITPLIPGSNASVVVTTTAPGILTAWADFYRNTNWSDAGEQIFADYPLGAGSNTLTFAVPWNAVPGSNTTRWRLSTSGGLSYTGYGGFGEVEDHLATVLPPVITQFAGVPHQSLGGASISVGSNGLAISNIGSSGQDGGLLDLKELSRTVSLNFGSNGFSLPNLAKLSVGAYGTVSGTPDQVLGSVSFEHTNGAVNGFWCCWDDWFFQTPRIEVYNGATLVGAYAVPLNGSIGTLSGDVRLKEVNFVAERGQDSFWDWDWWDFIYSPPGQPSTTVTGTRLRLIYYHGQAGLIDNLARLTMTGANIASLLIAKETAPRFQPRLGIEGSGQQLNIKWDTRSAVLQSSPTITGPWADVVDYTNKLSILPGAESAFYRVVVRELGTP